MFCFHLCSTTLIWLRFALSGDSKRSEPHPTGICCGRDRATGARGDASVRRSAADRPARSRRPASRKSVEHERGVAAARPMEDLQRSGGTGPENPQEPDREHLGAGIVGRARLVDVALHRRSERRRERRREHTPTCSRATPALNASSHAIGVVGPSSPTESPQRRTMAVTAKPAKTVTDGLRATAGFALGRRHQRRRSTRPPQCAPAHHRQRLSPATPFSPIGAAYASGSMLVAGDRQMAANENRPSPRVGRRPGIISHRQ